MELKNYNQMELKNYSNAKEFADNFIKDIAQENNNVYNCATYDKIEAITKLTGYKTDWLPSKVKELSKKDIENIVKNYPEELKNYKESSFWGKTEIKPTNAEVFHRVLFKHFLKEYQELEKSNAIKYFNNNK